MRPSLFSGVCLLAYYAVIICSDDVLLSGLQLDKIMLI